MSLASFPQSTRPLAYTGNKFSQLVPLVIFERAPTLADAKPYDIGTIWLDRVGRTCYVLVSKPSNVAEWLNFGSNTGVIETINLLSPTPAGNITISGTANQVVVSNLGSTITIGLSAVLVVPGSLTVASGNLTLTNGNLRFNTAGNKIVSVNVGTTAAAGGNSFGSVTLVGGTVTVATTAVTANSLVSIWRQSPGATGAAALGLLSVGTIVPGVSFDINALDPTDSTALIATDVSVVGWMIIN